MPATAEKIAVWKCRHCGYVWVPRKPIDPVQCPHPKCQKMRP